MGEESMDAGQLIDKLQEAIRERQEHWTDDKYDNPKSDRAQAGFIPVEVVTTDGEIFQSIVAVKIVPGGSCMITVGP